MIIEESILDNATFSYFTPEKITIREKIINRNSTNLYSRIFSNIQDFNNFFNNLTIYTPCFHGLYYNTPTKLNYISAHYFLYLKPTINIPANKSINEPTKITITNPITSLKLNE